MTSGALPLRLGLLPPPCLKSGPPFTHRDVAASRRLRPFPLLGPCLGVPVPARGRGGRLLRPCRLGAPTWGFCPARPSKDAHRAPVSPASRRRAPRQPWPRREWTRRSSSFRRFSARSRRRWRRRYSRPRAALVAVYKGSLRGSGARCVRGAYAHPLQFPAPRHGRFSVCRAVLPPLARRLRPRPPAPRARREVQSTRDERGVLFLFFFFLS